MSDEAAFLLAIDTNPDDDTARLVYADWLQERDDPRAEYVRLEVRRHRMTTRERRKADPLREMEALRPRAGANWLARIDRTLRLSVFWPRDVCDAAERDGLVGQPLTHVDSRGNHNTQFPKVMAPGAYLYVLAFRSRTLYVAARMRVARRVEETLGPFGSIPAITYTTAVEGTEGTAIRFDRAVPPEAIARLAWYSGKTVRKPSLDKDGRLLAAGTLASVLRLTPQTAADLDATLRGESPS